MIDTESKKHASIFEAMVDGVYVIDSDYNVEYMNDVMIKDFGRGVGGKCYQTIHGRDEVCSWCRAKDILAGKSVRW